MFLNQLAGSFLRLVTIAVTLAGEFLPIVVWRSGGSYPGPSASVNFEAILEFRRLTLLTSWLVV
jgi:hypothetical protein